MNKYLYERIAPIWIASLVKLHGDKCNLHFVYSKKRKSEICAFCCVFFFKLDTCVPVSRLIAALFLSLQHSLEWEYIFIILFHVLMQCDFSSLSLYFFHCRLQWRYIYVLLRELNPISILHRALISLESNRNHIWMRC